MFPTLTPSNQELLLALYQKQAQNKLMQPNVLTQLMKMNMQMNLLKLLNQNPANTPDLGTSQSKALSIPNYINQLANTNAQSSNIQDSQLANLLLYNKLLQRGQLGAEAAPNGHNSQQDYTKREIPALYESPYNGSKPLAIPAFSSSQESSQFQSPEAQSSETTGLSSKSKKIKKGNVCGHPERPHYAKNMCNQCYHKFGRTKKPWRCSHEKLYAHGLCQNCYINDYNKKRNQKPKDQKEDTNTGTDCNDGSETDGFPSATDEPLTMEDKTAFSSFAESENTATEDASNNSVAN